MTENTPSGKEQGDRINSLYPGGCGEKLKSMDLQLSLYKFFSRFRTSDKQLAARAEVLELYYRIYGVQYKARTMGLAEILSYYEEDQHANVTEVFYVVTHFDLWARMMRNKSRWASIIVRRYWVALIGPNAPAHVTADVIRDMYPMAHFDLSKCTEHQVENDCDDIGFHKYKTDWQRRA